MLLPPSRLAARIALIVFVAGCATWLLRLDYAAKISTNVLDLLPPAEQSEELALVRELATDVHARTMLFAVSDPSRTRASARDVSVRFAGLLRRSAHFDQVVALNETDAGRKLARVLFDQRHRLLLPTYLGERHREFERTRAPSETFSSWLAHRAAIDLDRFLTRPESAAMQSLATADPLLLTPRVLETFASVGFGGAAHDQEIALIWASLRASPLSEAGQRPVFAAIDTAFRDLQSTHPNLELRWTGVNRLAAASRAQIQSEFGLLNLCSLGAVLLVALTLIRNPWRVLHLVPIVLLSLLGAWTAVTFVFSQVHAIVFVVGALLCGVAVDYGFYLLLASRSHGGALSPRRHLLKPLLTACLTTVIGFSLLWFSSLPMLRQLGVFVAAGLVSALFAAWFYVSQLRDPHLEPRFTSTPRRSHRHSSAWPKVFATLAAVSSIAGISQIHWRDDLRDLEIPTPDLRTNDREVRALFGDSAGRALYLTHGGTLSETRERLGEFLAHIARTHPSATAASLGVLFPNAKDWDQFSDRLRELRGFADDFRAALEQRDFDGNAFASFFAAWPGAIEAPPADDYTALFQTIGSALEGPLAHFLQVQHPRFWFITITDEPSVMPPAHTQTLPLNQLESLNTLFGRYRLSALKLSLAGAGLLILSVALIYRSRAARIALIPAAACGFAFGALGLIGHPLNLFHLLGAFLGVCLSHDYAIFSTHDHRSLNLGAIRLSALTTAASFVVLGFSRIPAIHALGLTVTLIVLSAWGIVEIDARRRHAAV